MAMIQSSSTSASATVQLTLTIPELPNDLVGGSSIVLYLEDDFNVDAEGDGIDRDTVYFTAFGGSAADDHSTGNGRRVYATDSVEIDTDDHFTAGKDDWDIQVFIPDMNTSDVDQYAGFDGPKAGQTLTLTFTKAAGIRNPSEVHDSTNMYTSGYQTGYTVLGPADSVPYLKSNDATSLNDLFVHAKISLSDYDNRRSYELTVTGSGFNNGTSAAVYVLGDTSIGGVPDDPAEESALCTRIIKEGHRAGIATVGSDDRVAVTFEVTVPPFVPGNNNYICMVDGEGRASVSDVEDFNLLDSLRVVPSSANTGDVINVFALDFPNTGAPLTSLKIAGQEVLRGAAGCDPCLNVNATVIAADGSAKATFELPARASGIPLVGTVRIDAKWGDISEASKITVIQ